MSFEISSSAKYNSHLNEGLSKFRLATFAPSVSPESVRSAAEKICTSTGLDFFAGWGVWMYAVEETQRNYSLVELEWNRGHFLLAATSMLKTAGTVSLLFNGILGMGANFGIAYGEWGQIPGIIGPLSLCLSSGANLIDLLTRFVQGEELPENWMLGALSNAALVFGSSLVLGNAITNPANAALVLLGLSLFSLGCHLIQYWDVIREKIAVMAVWKKFLFLSGFTIGVGVTASGIAGASSIMNAIIITAYAPFIPGMIETAGSSLKRFGEWMQSSFSHQPIQAT